MAKMNWERVRTENRSALADHQTRNYLNQRKSQNRAAMRRKYGWWTKYGDDWFVAVDSEMTIGGERIVEVKKSNGTIVEYILNDIPEHTIEYEGGAYSCFKAKKVS